MRETMAVFPALMVPAREAARLVEGDVVRDIVGFPGLQVAARGQSAEREPFFTFEQDGRQFVIFQNASGCARPTGGNR